MYQLIEKIEEAINTLLSLASNCNRNDLIICYSPRLRFYIENEAYDYMIKAGVVYVGDTSITNFKGIEVNSNHFKNEIVVYHKYWACNNSRFLVIINTGLPC
jgi:hypothetical protein